MTKKFEKVEAFFKRGNVRHLGGRGNFAKVVKAVVDRNKMAQVRKLPSRGYDR